MLWVITYALTLFVCILIPIYWRHYGAQNFLWLSDVGLFLTVIALWLQSPLFISIAVILIFPLELFWLLDLIAYIIRTKPLLGIVDYMFDPANPLSIRLLSLFHIFVPIVWIWCLLLWGYDSSAFFYAVGLLWATLIATLLLTDKTENINWVFTPVLKQWGLARMAIWYIMLSLGIPVIIIWPLHLIFSIWLSH